MSQYDSSHPNLGDSRATTRAKEILEKVVRDQFKTKGYKVVGVKSEVPATFSVAYHADLGVLVRSIEIPDTYHFFIIEIDSRLGHRTFLKDMREDERAKRFMAHSGIVTIRFNLEEIVGREKKLSESDMFQKIWKELMYVYIEQDNYTAQERNIEFAANLKENAFTRCRGCDHLAHQHTLTGCTWQQANKAKMRCSCTNPYFTSDA